MNRRRAVRVTQSFFDRLDEILPSDRTAAGGPSATDFLLHDLPALIDALALDFEASTHPVADREDRRDDLQAKLEAADWDPIVVDEAHRMATFEPDGDACT